jgi:glycosyltransferase involved in cell wall biosynthesis
LNILIVTAVYPPEPVVSAQTSAQIAKELSIKGYSVSVVAPFPSRPSGMLYPRYRRRFVFKEKDKSGVKIFRCFTTLSKKSTIFSRFIENFSFGLTSGLWVLTAPRPTLIYANSWPIVATGILAIIAKLRKIPIIISVQDIYPDSLVIQGRITADRIVAKTMRLIDCRILAVASKIIVISSFFKDILIRERQINNHKIDVVPNWVDSNTIDIEISKDAFRTQLRIPKDAFVFAYAGNIGVAAGMSNVIKAFSKTNNKKDVYLLIAGDGSSLQQCKEHAIKSGNSRIVFYNPWPASETSLLLRTADVFILPTRGDQSLSSVPSKLIGYMLAARPVIATVNVNSETTQIIHDAKCGWVIPPDSSEDLAFMINRVLKIDKERLSKLGQSGREYALKYFSSEACLPKVIRVFKNELNRYSS